LIVSPQGLTFAKNGAGLQHGEETKDYKNNQSKTIQPEKT
jgi:hypothetical protein